MGPPGLLGCHGGSPLAAGAPRATARPLPELRRLPIDSAARHSPIQRLEVDTALGNVHVAAGPAVAVYARTATDDCDAATSVQDGCLQVRAGHTSQGAACQANLDIIVPAGTHITLRCGAGDARLHGPLGSLDVRLGTGDVHAWGRFAHVEAQVGSGSLQVRGMTCGGHITARHGDVCLQYAVPPPAGRLTVRSAQGNVRIVMPRAPVRAALQSTRGHRHNELEEDAEAPFAIAASATGDISLQALSGT